MKTITVTESQMDRIKSHLFEKYSWLHRKNTAYTARLISSYQLTFDESFEKDIMEAFEK